jgi:polysaccharide biosynthesis protein PslH
MKITVISPVYPYPPVDGDRIRIFNIIRQLKETGHHKLHLVTFCKSGEEANNFALKKYFDTIETVVIGKSRIIAGALKGVFSSAPLNIAAYSDDVMKETLKRSVETNRPDVLFVYRLRMAQYADKIDMPKVIDYVDSLGLFMKRSAVFENSFIKKIYYMFDGPRVERYEKMNASMFDSVLINSGEDRDYLGADNIIVAPNGAIKCAGQKKKKNGVYTVGFMGNMPYGPNREAVTYFIKKVWKKSFNNDKNIRLVIAGRGARKFSGLIASSNIVYKDNVSDAAAEVSSWNMSVVPVRYGAGRQNKVMDCWACRIPVVAAPFAAGGVYGVDGFNMLIAKNDDEFAEKIRLLQGSAVLSKKIAANAAKTVKKHFDWKRTGIIINRAIIKAAK